MYESTNGSLYVKKDNAFYPCRVSVSPTGTEVTVTGEAVTSLPSGIHVSLYEVVVRHGITEGGEYPVAQPKGDEPTSSASKSAQPKK